MLKKKLNLLLLLVISGCVALGCKTIVKEVSPKQKFRLTNPQEASHYVELHKASIEVYRFYERQIYAAKKHLYDSLQKKYEQGENLSITIPQYRNKTKEIFDSTMAGIDMMAKEYNPETDHLFFYQYESEERDEGGWLVICDGRIKRKYPISISVVSTNDITK